MRIRRRRLRDALVAIGCLVAVVDPVGSPAGRARFAAAVLLLALGSLLHFWSKGCLEQNRKLVTAGPYRFTRNPFYLANGLIDLGLCCLIGRAWLALPYAVVWGLAYHETIRGEEMRLAELFGEAFARYRAAVPRLIPTGRSLPRAETKGQFTLDNPALAEGSEYARILGVWIAAATIVAWDWIGANGLAVFAPEQTAALGFVSLVPVAWVVKLALAEVFRSPQTALLPFAEEPSARRLVTFVLVAGLYVAARVLDASPRSVIASVSFGAMFVAIAVLPRGKTSLSTRVALQAGLAVAIGVFAWSRGVLWLASLPLVWVVLAAMDDGARQRLELRRGVGEPRSIAVRSLWSAFRPIATVVPIALVCVLAARFLIGRAV
ncbi:isoprenylcysteine carboxylmethyltransferase family protein [Myxococcota bacterium]|nr:isoprenylcysteine carboxylmethyltransferase family protein [Myxococcota bacterium]